MISLGLRLTVSGGREAVIRLVLLVAAVGLGVGLLLAVLACVNAVPLLAVAAVSIGIGFAAAAMYTTIEMQHPLVAPGVTYYVITAAGLVASLGIIAATFPLLRRITSPEAARNE